MGPGLIYRVRRALQFIQPAPPGGLHIHSTWAAPTFPSRSTSLPSPFLARLPHCSHISLAPFLSSSLPIDLPSLAFPSPCLLWQFPLEIELAEVIFCWSFRRVIVEVASSDLSGLCEASTGTGSCNWLRNGEVVLLFGFKRLY